MRRRPPRSTQSRSSAASDVYKRQLTYWSWFVLWRLRRFHRQCSLDPLLLDSASEHIRFQEGTSGRVVVGKTPAAAVETRPAAATLLFGKQKVGVSEFLHQFRAIQGRAREDIAHPVLLNAVKLMAGEYVPVRSDSHVFDTSPTSIDALAETWPCFEIQLEVKEVKPRT